MLDVVAIEAVAQLVESQGSDAWFEVDPAKIASVFRSVSKDKPLVGFKDAKIRDFFDPARSLLETVDNLHSSFGT